MKTLIRNASVVLPEGTRQTSVLIDGDRIAAIEVSMRACSNVNLDVCTVASRDVSCEE